MSIHPTAVVDPRAELGADVVVHPYAVIEAGARIGDRCQIGPHVQIHGCTRMGCDNYVAAGTVLGDRPQDLKYKGEASYVQIGDGNHIREYVTIHRATGEGNSTVVGDNCMLMAYSHLGHNAQIGSNIMIANMVQCGGHAMIDDYAVIGAMAGLHQFVRVGTMCMVGGFSVVRIDVPPYTLADGNPARPRKLNLVGLRRRGLTSEAIKALHHAFRTLYHSELNMTDALAALRAEADPAPEVVRMLDFVQRIHEGERGRQLD